MVGASLQLTVLCLALAAAAVFDAAQSRIPNALTGSLALFGLASAATAGAGTLGMSLLGLLAGAALLLPWRLLGGVGSGDLKLMAAIGAVAGPREALAMFLAAALIGAVLGLALMAMDGERFAPLRRLFNGLVLTVAARESRLQLGAPHANAQQLPYALPIAFGTALVLAAHEVGLALPAPF